MPKSKLSKEHKRAILDARNMIADIQRKDANEAETRRRVERIFERITGYDVLTHLSRERAVHGAGDTEHVDFVIQMEAGEDATPIIMVELKRVGVDLAPKHLKQACRYAIDAGCEWVLLTNGRQWRLYHVEFGQPPVTKLVEQWDLLHDEPETLAKKFALISLRGLKRGVLGTLWERTKILAPRSLLKAVLSPDSINALRRVLKRETGVPVTADHIVAGLRKMLNESAASVLDDVEVSLPEPKKNKPRMSEKPTSPRCTLKDLVRANLIRPETTLFVEYKGTVHEATVQPDGTILFEGKLFKTPSAAGGAVTAKHGVHAPNGWWFWQLNAADGSPKPLETIRQEYSNKAQPARGVETAEQSTVG